MRRALALTALLSTFSSHALAHRAPIVADRAVGAEELAVPSGGGASTMGARAMMVQPPPPVQASQFRAQLQGRAAEIEACMAAAGFAGSTRVTATMTPQNVLSVAVVVRPHDDAAVRDCAELAVRRALDRFAHAPLARTLRSSLTVRHRLPRAPRVPPVVPEPSPAGDAFAAPVHAAIDRDRTALVSCLSSPAPELEGSATLQVTFTPDGRLTLVSVSLPHGAPVGTGLPCMSARIANLQVAPAPPRAITIEHTLPLGL
jgi:hypothetical protein